MTPYEFLTRTYLENGEVASHIKNCRPIGIHEPGHAPQHACEIWLEPIPWDDDHITLHLDNAPTDEDTELLVKDLGGTVSNRHGRTHIRLTIGTRDSAHVNALAKAIRALIGRGRSYSNKNWRWVCPKAAATLSEFARHLRAYRRQLRSLETMVRFD